MPYLGWINSARIRFETCGAATGRYRFTFGWHLDASAGAMQNVQRLKPAWIGTMEAGSSGGGSRRTAVRRGLRLSSRSFGLGNERVLYWPPTRTIAASGAGRFGHTGPLSEMSFAISRPSLTPQMLWS